jgi:hypothetical protein
MTVGEQVAPDLQGLAHNAFDRVTPAFKAGVKVLNDDGGGVGGGGHEELGLLQPIARETAAFSN